MSLSDSEIVQYLKDLEAEGKNIRFELLKTCWYMRGGLTYQESLNMSYEERKMCADIIKDNLETTKKTGRDFF